MKEYVFTMRLCGYGNTPEEAWLDVAEATDLYKEPLPDKDDWYKIENDDEDEC